VEKEELMGERKDREKKKRNEEIVEGEGGSREEGDKQSFG